MSILNKNYKDFTKELMSTGLFKTNYEIVPGCRRFVFHNVKDIELRIFDNPDGSIRFDFVCIEKSYLGFSFEEVLRMIDRETAKRLLFHLDLFT